uniref:Uncharacterized protein n=1 Tax=Chromera velia CCMP2878 TaxID=1169474 RepID=A0A0G4F3N4_9ALVE|eukprot:Cvel_14850.t1-p1 / transcript=Cvel_14850.t1 / gene=Cvel_14850 / organism=Chromera_velia_CCMP2878 / gene_product=hypothetical protein / transcript_product=hypothetical protein / location=Cvel_scaffold1073:540-3059(-) / protein_length=325 / sequence_SO=supercontig / SO=protein_coding / is_pseudo=false
MASPPSVRSDGESAREVSVLGDGTDRCLSSPCSPQEPRRLALPLPSSLPAPSTDVRDPPPSPSLSSRSSQRWCAHHHPLASLELVLLVVKFYGKGSFLFLAPISRVFFSALSVAFGHEDARKTSIDGVFESRARISSVNWQAAAQQMKTVSPNPYKHNIGTTGLIRECAAAGSTGALSWVSEHSGFSIGLAHPANDGAACRGAASGGHVHVLEWLMCERWVNVQEHRDAILQEAGKAGQVAFLKEVTARGLQRAPLWRWQPFKEKFLQVSALAGHDSVILWAASLQRRTDANPNSSPSFLKAATAGLSPHVLQQLQARFQVRSVS